MMAMRNSPAPAEPPASCTLCPRLVAYREENARQEPHWFNGAVPSFGDEQARLLIVGLAPGRTGANRTARPFTGDWAGDLLYATIDRFAFSEGTYRADPGDGLTLKDAMITNAVRCAPPQNKPVGEEMANCRPFLAARIAALPKLKVMIALGRIAHENTLRALGHKPSGYTFAHGAEHEVEGPQGTLTLIDSYHCSRYNTNTGRLTEPMFHAVFEKAKARL